MAPHPHIRPAIPADAAGIAAIHVRSWRETYAGLMPPAFLDAMTSDAMRARREQHWARTLQDGSEAVRVAEMDGRLMAFASAGPTRPHPAIPGGYAAELYTLYALRAGQGHGVGRALLRALLPELQAWGATGLALWVLSANPTRAYYARQGAHELGQKTETTPHGDLTETAMGWPDLTRLR